MTDLQSTATKYLENTDFERSTVVESNTLSSMKEGAEATADYSSVHTELLRLCRCHCGFSQELVTGAPDEPGTVMEATGLSGGSFKIKQILLSWDHHSAPALSTEIPSCRTAQDHTEQLCEAETQRVPS